VSEYIEREALLKNAQTYSMEFGEYIGEDVRDVDAILADRVKEAPAADVAPVVHGEWLNFTGDFSTAECNQCGELYEVSPDEKPCEDFFSAFKKFYKFCPNCGAKMNRESEEEK
jgi:NADH pyrophosphatase NudC (nudix superfamily)